MDPITIDLSDFDPTMTLPGWDGSGPSQSTPGGLYPSRVDLRILGHRSRSWTGGGFIRGGRNVHWLGGTYERGPWLRNFTGNACAEGILTRSPFDAEGIETGDGVSLLPDPSTLARSSISVLNSRVEAIDGLLDGGHGDCFQLPSSYDTPDGYSSTPAHVVIERFTGTTGYQGLFLANQHFDDFDYTYSCQSLVLRDVNLSKTRPSIMVERGEPREGHVRLLYLADMVNDLRGDRPYPREFTNVYLEPWSDEGLEGCIFPDLDAGVSPATGTSLAPMVSADGQSATFPPELQITGQVRLGAPPDGDFVGRAGPDGRGGLGIPGIGYISPGYT